jgi:uncharacterized protein (TIGR02145 family)
MFLPDIDDNIYQIITIGATTWMAENLATTKFSNGDAIDYNFRWNSTSNHSPEYCFYKNNSPDYRKFGAYYNWFTVHDKRNVCPGGWHVPTHDEWWELYSNLGFDRSGGKMKTPGTSFWKSPNRGATNESGFSALPGGYCNKDGFIGFGETGQWWSSTALFGNDDQAFQYVILYDDIKIAEMGLDKSDGINIRCIKDK